jgi:hypothetical protein
MFDELDDARFDVVGVGVGGDDHRIEAKFLQRFLGLADQFPRWGDIQGLYLNLL